MCFCSGNIEFSPNMAWIAVRDFVEASTYRSLRLFNVDNKALINNGAAINAATTTGVEGVWFSRDSNRIFFSMRPTATPNELHL